MSQVLNTHTERDTNTLRQTEPSGLQDFELQFQTAELSTGLTILVLNKLKQRMSHVTLSLNLFFMLDNKIQII